LRASVAGSRLGALRESQRRRGHAPCRVLRS